MVNIVAELLATLGMVLCAGEYVQGSSRWFNRAIERLMLAISPMWWFRPYKPLLVARGICRLQSNYIVFFIVVPLSVMTWAVWSTNLLTRQNSFIVYAAALETLATSPDPQQRDQAEAALRANIGLVQECFPLMTVLKEPKGDERNERITKLQTCLKTWDRQRQFDVQTPLATRLWLLAQHRPRDAIEPVALSLLTVGCVVYFLSLSLLVSRLYTRFHHIESFILPVGFSFAAVGQLIKLVLVFF